MKGTVKWFNDGKGYGFITYADSNEAIKEAFAHYSAITTEGFKTLVEGQLVEFDLVDGPKGSQCANIRKEVV
jgi:CspA family cold shock protein